jgi:hypothetical protein
MFKNGDINGKQEIGIVPYQYNSLYHRIYILGLPLVAGAVIAFLAWKDSHLSALLIMATFFAVISIYEMRVRGWNARSIVALCLLWYVLAWSVFQIAGPNIRIETDNEVYLIPGNKLSPSDVDCAPQRAPADAITFFVGSNKFW